MTTIAHKDGIIAFDSRVTQGNEVLSDTENKCITLHNVQFVAGGAIDEIHKLIHSYFDHSAEYHPLEANAFVVDPNRDGVLQIGYGKKGYWEMDITNYQLAMGDGEQYAVGAMEAGLSAKEAVKIAAKRNIYTGGRIRTIKV